MNSFITKKYPLRVSDFDRYNRILPSSVLDLFQDAAGIHADSLGVSGPQLLKRNLCWMLTKVRYEVLKQPSLYSDVVVKTWPIESHRIELDRDYEIYSESGELLIRGTSSWVVMDITDRSAPKLVMARDFELGLDEYLTERTFEKAFGRVVYNKVECVSPYVVCPAFTDLDMNGHVNNIKYASFALSAISGLLSADKSVYNARIDYSKELLTGETLRIHTEKRECEDGASEILCRGESDSCPLHFGVRFIVK